MSKFDLFMKNKRVLIQKLKRMIKYECGNRCKDYYFDCFVCQTYMALDIIEQNMLYTDRITEKHWKLKDKK